MSTCSSAATTARHLAQICSKPVTLKADILHPDIYTYFVFYSKMCPTGVGYGYTGDSVCKVYDCCVNGKGYKNCGECGGLPCEKFTKDPTVSDEENAAHLESMIKRLKG